MIKSKSSSLDDFSAQGLNSFPAEIDVAARLAKLSPTQMAVLELVALQRTSKEIARQLNISPVTVDQRIKRIQHLIGASSRSQAARCLLAAKGNGVDVSRPLYGKTIYESSGLAEGRPGDKLRASLGEWNPAGGGETKLKQSQAIYDRSANAWLTLRPLSSVLEAVNRREKSSLVAKMIIIMAIMIATIIAFALLVTLAEGLSRLL